MSQQENYFSSFLTGKEVKERVRKILQRAQINGHIDKVEQLVDLNGTSYYVTVSEGLDRQRCYRVDLKNDVLIEK